MSQYSSFINGLKTKNIYYNLASVRKGKVSFLTLIKERSNNETITLVVIPLEEMVLRAVSTKQNISKCS